MQFAEEIEISVDKGLVIGELIMSYEIEKV